MHHNSSPTFLLSSPSKVATFYQVKEAIDVLTIDVLIDVSTTLSFGKSSCSWSTSSSLASHSFTTWTSTYFGFSCKNNLSFSELESYCWMFFSYYFPLWHSQLYLFPPWVSNVWDKLAPLSLVRTRTYGSFSSSTT